MSETFLLNLMRVVYDVTRAERAFAVNNELSVLGTVNIVQEAIEAPYLHSSQQAMMNQEPIITDNYTMTLDPTKAPVTNQSFPKLRFVLILPVAGFGAICLDQSLHTAVTSKDKVDRLMKFINQVIAGQQLELDEDELTEIYNGLQS